MHVTATEARSRLGKMLEHCQREPVTIEKSGHRHSVLISAAQYDALVAAGKPSADGADDPGKAFYEKYKDWVDAQNAHVEKYGIVGEEFRSW